MLPTSKEKIKEYEQFGDDYMNSAENLSEVGDQNPVAKKCLLHLLREG